MRIIRVHRYAVAALGAALLVGAPTWVASNAAATPPPHAQAGKPKPTKPPTSTSTTTTVTPSTTTTTTATPSTTTTATVSAGWPDANNTGYTGTLAAYTGPCSITTAGTVIDSADVKAKCGGLDIKAANVSIRNSRLPMIAADYGPTYSVSISDSEVVPGHWQGAGIDGSNITITRSEVLGAKDAVNADSNVTVTDSWLHGLWNPEPADCPSNMPNCSFHNQAFGNHGGSHLVVRHNTLHCDVGVTSNGGGCTADLTLLGDFATVSDVLVENNLLKANPVSIPFCTYGGSDAGKPYPNANNVRYLSNVFERGPNGRCGDYGPVTDFDPNAVGNVWSGNVWDDGTTVPIR